MKNFALIAAAALTAVSFGAAAIAADTGDFVKADGNNDLKVTFDEARGNYPTLSQEVFDQADTNKDGTLDEAEFTGLVGLSAGLDGAENPSAAAPAVDTSSSSSSGNDGTSTPSSSAQ